MKQPFTLYSVRKMRGAMKASICVFVIVMFFIPVTAIQRVSSEKEVDEWHHIQTASNDDYIDQKQETETGF